MKTYGVRRLQSNGQVSIPRALVKAMDLGTGDLVLFEKNDCGVVIRKAKVTGVASV